MMDIEGLLSDILLQSVKRQLNSIENAELKLICETYSERLVPEIASQFCYGRMNAARLEMLSMQQARIEFNRMKPQINKVAAETLFTVLHKVAEELPYENGKAVLENEVYDIASSGLQTFIDEESWQAAETVIVNKTRGYVSSYAKSYAHSSLEKARQYLPSNKYALALCNDADYLAADIIDAAVYGRDIDYICDMALDRAQQSLVKHGSSYVSDWTRTGIKAGAQRLHVQGRNSRKINRHIDSAADLMSDSLTGHLTDNIGQLVSGEKDLAEAVTDTAVGTARDTAIGYVEKHGAELAADAIKSITQSVAKKMGNEAAKQAVLRSGNMLANTNAVTAVAGAVIDIGTSFKELLDGKITKAQFLRKVGEQGSGACLATIYGTVGAVIGGPVGAAIGSMIGYMASSMLYGAVLTQFEREDAARLRSEQVHAFCEQAIAEMRWQRAQFEAQANELLRQRAYAATQGFAMIDRALIGCDFNGLSVGLNTIAQSFGKELQFTNFAEFDAFMQSDEDFDL